MGRVKELYSDILQAYEGNIPGHVTVADIIRLKEIDDSEWKEHYLYNAKVLHDEKDLKKLKAVEKNFRRKHAKRKKKS